jgi:hypothetical protein
MKVDLDPGAGQKVAAYKLASKFPSSGVKSEATVKDDLLRKVLDEEDEADYDKNVKPWLGDRAGMAFLKPSSAKPNEPQFIAAVQYTDKDKAEAGLKASIAKTKAAGGEDDLHYAFADGQDYVLLAETQPVADSAVSLDKHLVDNPEFTKGVKALDGDQIVMGWVDVAAVWNALPEAKKQEARKNQEGLDPSGLVVVGAHAADNAFEIVGKSVDISGGDSAQMRKLVDNPMGKGKSSGVIKQLPDDSLFAASITGLGDGLAASYDALPAETKDNAQFQSALDQFGLKLPEDFKALFGTETAFTLAGSSGSSSSDSFGAASVVDQFKAGIRVVTTNPDRALELINKTLDSVNSYSSGESKAAVAEVDKGYVLGYGLDSVKRDLTTGTLGQTESFRTAVPEVDDSGVTFYINLQKVLKQAGERGLTAEQLRNAKVLDAVGITSKVEDGGNGSFKLRLTVK